MAAVALAAVGCGGDDGGSDEAATTAEAADTAATSADAAGTSDTAGTADAAGATEPAKPPSGDPIRVVYIPKNLGNTYFDAIIAGFNSVAPSLNITLEVVGPAQAGAEDQIQYIDAAIQQKVDAIAISPNDPDAVVPSLKRAMDAGIKVITVNSDMNPEGRMVAVLPVDFATLPDDMLELMSTVMGKPGDFAIVSATSSAPDQSVWVKAMKESLEAGKTPEIKLTDVVFGDDEPDKSAEVTRALLSKYGDELGGILSPTTVGLPVAAQVVSVSPLKGKVQVTGLGTPNLMRPYVKDGTVKQFALWDPQGEGALSAYLIAGLMDGSIKAEPGTKFSPGDLGPHEITEDTQLITGPLKLFDANNIDDYDF